MFKKGPMADWGVIKSNKTTHICGTEKWKIHCVTLCEKGDA